VTQKLAPIDTIARTNTLIAFRAYSSHDLERFFSVGSDEGNGGWGRKLLG